jgi:DNA repair exonuclease SbcCD ATPase subunit
MAKIVALALMLSCGSSAVVADLAEGNPLGKVLELLNSLEVKLAREGDKEAAAFNEFFQWCDKASKNLNHEIKTYTNSNEKQEAKIKEFASDIEVSVSKIEDLSGALAKSEAELNDANRIRSKEAADFATSEKELLESVDALDRAVNIISSEMAKNPAALAQIDTTSIATLAQSLSLVVDAAGVSSADQQKLVALVQSSQDEEEMGAPSTSAYKSQSSGIVDLLEELKDKAENELSEARKRETNAKNNFAMMKQSLQDQMAADTKDLNEEKAAKEDAADEKAKMEGDLAITVPDLKDDKESLETFNQDCMQSAADHEATMNARKEEQAVIAKAKKILGEAMGKSVSLFQLKSTSRVTMQTRADLANSEVLVMLKKLAHEQHSAALSQLASRIAVVAKYGNKDGADPFAKIKGLISDMIHKLQTEAESEATEKSFCIKETAETEAKRDELDFDISKVVAKIDQAVARATELKDESNLLHEEVAELSETLAELSAVRQTAKENYLEAKADLDQGLAAVQRALGLLRDYYGTAEAMIQESPGSGAFLQQPAKPQPHAKAGGAGDAIIGILEVVESDFANGLSKESSEEEDAEAQHEKISQEKTVCKATKESDLKYKKIELVSLEKTITELTADKDSSDSQRSAVLQYYARVKERCVAHPDTYESRVARREAEINGLKEALSIIESEAAFIQKKTKRMRGGVIQ